MKNIEFLEFINLIKEVTNRILDLSHSKGAEYRGKDGNSNIHVNFDRMASRLNLTPEKVLSVLLSKHMDSIDTYVNSIDVTAGYVGKPMSEPIEGRIDDAILYLMILRAMAARRNPVKECANPCQDMSDADIVRAMQNRKPMFVAEQTQRPPGYYFGSPGSVTHVSNPDMPIG